MKSGIVTSMVASIFLFFVYGCFALNQIAATTRVSGDETYFLFSGVRIFDTEADRLLKDAIQSAGARISELVSHGAPVPEGLKEAEYYLNLEFQQSSDEYRIPALVTGLVYKILEYIGYLGPDLIGASFVISPIVFTFLAATLFVFALIFVPCRLRLYVSVAVGVAFLASWLYEVYFYRIFYEKFMISDPHYLRMLIWGALKFTDDYFVFAHYPRSAAYGLILVSSVLFAAGCFRAAFFLCLVTLAFHATHGLLFFVFLTLWYIMSIWTGGLSPRRSDLHAILVIGLMAGLSFVSSVSFYLATGLGINYPPLLSALVVLALMGGFLYVTSGDGDRAAPVPDRERTAFFKRVICGLVLIAVIVSLACGLAAARGSHSSYLLVLRLGSIFVVVLTSLSALSLVASVRRWGGAWGVPVVGVVVLAAALYAQHNVVERLRQNERNQVTAARIYLQRVGQPLDFSKDNQRHRIYFAIFSALASDSRLNLAY